MVDTGTVRYILARRFLHPLRIASCLCCLLLLAAPAFGQLATILGVVTDAGDGQPLQGVNVALRSTSGELSGTATQEGGQYVLSRIQPGDYVLAITFIGYSDYRDTLAIGFGDRLTINVRLESDTEELDGVVVESDRGASGGAVSAGFETVRAAELNRIPVAGLSADLVNYLTGIPGVVTTGDRGGQLFVRGGTPSQNLFLVDGMRVLQPIHIVGLFSSFPADIIAYTDVYAGGFGSPFGGTLSSVFDVHTRNGNKRRVDASASIAPFLATGRLEIPIVKDRVSIMGSVRRSLIDRTAPEIAGEELPFKFGDTFLKFHGFVSPTSHVAFTALNTFDEGNLAAGSDRDGRVAWNNEAFGGQFFYLSPTFPVLTQVSISTTRFEIYTGGKENPRQSSLTQGFNGHIGFGYLLGSSEIHFGLFGESMEFDYRLSRRFIDRREEFITEGGAFIEATLRRGRNSEVSAGYRLHSFPSRGQTFGEPRFRFSVSANGGTLPVTINGAAGIYHQTIVALTNDRVVSNVFTAWAPSPQNRPVPKSVHGILGVSTSPMAGVDFSLEGYWMSVDHIGFPPLGRELDADTILDNVEGASRGVDVRLEATRKRWFASASYGLGFVEYNSESGDFSPPHDRRHQIGLLAGGTWRGLKLNINWVYGSGLPFTPINGFYSEVDVTNTGVNASDEGRLSIFFDDSFSDRLPSFHRLDVTLDYAVKLPYSRLTFQVGAINVYDQDNLFDFDYFSLSRINQLPFIPSVGMKLDIE